MIWEIFNKCSGNQMRDVHIEEIDTEDPGAFVAGRFRDGYDISCTEEQGALVFEILKEGLRQRVSLTEL
jgi:hypothetical protein